MWKRDARGRFTEDTSLYIYTPNKFYVKPGKKRRATGVRYLVIRYDDERSSEICKKIESLSKLHGGIVIDDPSDSAVSRGLSSSYRTRLFHSNCRCRLFPKPSAFGDVTTDVNFKDSILDTAVRAVTLRNASKKMNERDYKKLISSEYSRRLQMVFMANLFKSHKRHDRRKK